MSDIIWLIGFPLSVGVIGVIADRITYGNWLRWW